MDGIYLLVGSGVLVLAILMVAALYLRRRMKRRVSELEELREVGTVRVRVTLVPDSEQSEQRKVG